MKNWALIGIIGLLFVLVSRSEATEQTLIFPDRTRVAQAVRDCTKEYGPLVVETGEILATADERITLRGATDGREKVYSCAVATVFINGQLGVTTALRPIAPQFYFVARLYFDYQGVLRLVDGCYAGVEGEVLAVDTADRGLTVRPLDQSDTWGLTFASPLSHSDLAFTPGECCYFLLDWENNIRKVIRR
jgi:hypothetical protein